MKRILKVLLYSILGIIIAGLIISYIAYWSFSPGIKSIEVKDADLVFFQESYPDARNEFLARAKVLQDRYENVRLLNYHIESKIDTNLIMDICYIPPQQVTGRLLIITSGLHGIEGYTGSAIQQMFMKELITEEEVLDEGILLIHSINPFGFKYMRKTTENNIDLNRNCDVDKSMFENKNQGYADLYDLLCPAGKANSGSLGNRFFYLVAIWKIIQESMATLRQAALQGQYEFPEGIYYGGNDFEPQIYFLQSVLPEIFDPYDLILTIDLHTGYGMWGKLHLFANPVEDELIRKRTENLFVNQPIDWGDSEDFYTTMGDFCNFLGQLNPDATYLSMPFEFGTLDSQKTFGSLHSIQNAILENQGYHNGYKNDRQEKKIKKNYREMYYPSSAPWRSEVIRQSREMFTVVLENYQ